MCTSFYFRIEESLESLKLCFMSIKYLIFKPNGHFDHFDSCSSKIVNFEGDWLNLLEIIVRHNYQESY